ncbi:MAG: translation initiation factor IF-2 [Janthinobacterium lividum]
MSDGGNDQDTAKGRLSLRPAGPLGLGRTVDAGSVRQSFSHGRSKVVQVEVRKKRGPIAPTPPPPGQGGARPTSGVGSGVRGPAGSGRALTASELATRQRVLEEQKVEAAKREIERREQEKINILSAAEEARRKEEEARRAAEDEERRARDAVEQAKADEAARAAAEAASAAAPSAKAAEEPRRAVRPPATTAAPASPSETLRLRPQRAGEDDEAPRRRSTGPIIPGRKPPAPAPKKVLGDGTNKRPTRIDVQAAIEGDDDKSRSLASVRRQRESERRKAELVALRSNQVKVQRDVVLPDSITVSELANRMATRGADVIKALMKMGVMATVTQSLDADTAELVVQEFGHRVRRVSESDVEQGIDGAVDVDTDLQTRPPVVTIMGHVDHGKTSLLDALRATDVVKGEAGGITQHIGAYQVTLPSGQQITFLDTPGHEAFTAMRSRGAQVTDIVVLVVAGDDGVMPQTIEAIRHAKAANAPLIVAINKMDKPGSDPQRVRQELLSHEVVVEDMGGETQDVQVSATKRTGLDKLEEAIMLQAEVLDLRANPDRTAEGAVIEGRLDRGRGPVATMLVQKGTLRQGEIVVAGAEWGRIRAMLDDKGQQIKEAGPSTPVEILGLSGVPGAGDPFVVVENEMRAREISEFRQRKVRAKASAGLTAARGTMEQMLARAVAGAQKEVALLIKTDVQGSAEAIQATVLKLEHEEVNVRVLNSSVGQITESDIQLAKASDAMIVGFNVRATAQAKALATRDEVEIRYYSIIYQVIDDIEQMVKGKISPKYREKFLGYAEIRKVFDITKSGKVAGCMITEGVVKRGCGVRLLRDNVVIHQGELSVLKRFKDDVKEVARGYECGLSFAGFQDLREGDMVECYEPELIPA